MGHPRLLAVPELIPINGKEVMMQLLGPMLLVQPTLQEFLQEILQVLPGSGEK
jgi:hypothetical protein